jgi:WD40 repeat protein
MARTMTLNSPASLVTFVNGGSTLAAIGEDGELRLFDLKSGSSRTVRKAAVSRRLVSAIPGTDRLAMVDEKGGVQIWDTKTALNQNELSAIPPRPSSLTVSRGGSLVATSHMPDRQTSVNIIRVRDMSGKELFSAPAGLGGLSAVSFSPDGSTIVAGSNDADLRVWTVRNGELVKVIDSLPVTTFAIEFSPDGNWLATAGVDRTVYLWNTKTWKLEQKLSGQPELINALTFSPDGKRLVTGGFDSAAMANAVKLIVWDVATAKPVQIETVPHAVIGVAFSPDGKHIAAISARDRTVRLWQAPD